MKKFYWLYAVLAFVFLTGCGPAFLKKMIKDNPEIITESIQSNPEVYMEALADAQRQYMLERRKKQQEREQADREKEFQNPKNPELKDSRVYFGKKSAPITIVEYSDFQCGYCAKAVKTLKRVLKNYPDKVRILYKHKPLFPGSSKAAEYYEAIGMQDSKKARDFHDMVFKRKNEIRNGEKFLKELAKKLKVNMSKLEKDLSLAENIVQEDAKEAEKFGFTGTPGFLVGGISLPGAMPYSEFKKIIDRHLTDMSGGGKKESKEDKKEDAKKEKGKKEDAKKEEDKKEDMKKEDKDQDSKKE